MSHDITAQEFREAADLAADWCDEGAGTKDAGSIDAFIGRLGDLLRAATEQREALDELAAANARLINMRQQVATFTAAREAQIQEYLTTLEQIASALQVSRENTTDVTVLLFAIYTLTNQVAALTVERDEWIANARAVCARAERAERKVATLTAKRDELRSWVMRWQNHLACNGFQDAIEELGLILTVVSPDPG
jgi:DNA repair exonuclease SbcCD ATPase subunit